MEKKKYEPYIPAGKVMPELTPTSIILGVILAIVFGGANAYLGLRVGMTVSASIPAAVVSMGIIRKILRRDSILENNMVQTIGSAGEALAGGAIFTIPVLFMWAAEGVCNKPTVLEIGLICLCGGILGVTFMIPLRNTLIVQEHGTLPYPEGKACSEVLIAGEEGGDKSALVFGGLGISAVYKFIADGLHIFPSEVDYAIPAYKGSGIGLDVLPALAGVGYICGVHVSSYLFTGGILAWFILMPVIALFGNDLVIFPASVSVGELVAGGGAWALWSNYIRYIGAGAVVTGGIISLIKSLPLIVKTVKESIGKLGGQGEESLRTEQDLPMSAVLILTLISILAIWLLPVIPVNLLGAVIIALFGFFFAAVTSRIVGLVGCNNNPGSGMTIATLMITCLIFKITGNTGASGMVAAIAIGCVICTIIAVSGDTSQDLKTGFLIGSTPRRQQIGEMIGILVAAVVIGFILYLLNATWGYATAELPAPQAMLMKMVVEGVMEGNLPWTLLAIGAFSAIMMEIIGIPVLPFGIGMYLPIHLSAAIMCGGLVRAFLEKKKYASDEEKKGVIESGILYTSGLIAGEGVVGILLAVLVLIPFGAGTLADAVNISEHISLGKIGGLIFFALLLWSIFHFSLSKKKVGAEK